MPYSNDSPHADFIPKQEGYCEGQQTQNHLFVGRSYAPRGLYAH